MNYATYRISLDIHDTGSQTCLDVKKLDSQRKIITTLTEEGKPYAITSDCTAVFRAKKPDGTILYNNCSIVGNTIEYALTNQTVAAVGEVECEITLYGADSKQITSPRFTMIVEDTLYSDDEVESEDEFTELAEAIAAADTLDISVSKSGTVTTVVVTHSDGTTDTVYVNDGVSGASTWNELRNKPFETIGDNLKIVGRALTVDTAPNVERDNTKPITSAAVYTEVGNINALLALI